MGDRNGSEFQYNRYNRADVKRLLQQNELDPTDNAFWTVAVMFDAAVSVENKLLAAIRPNETLTYFIEDGETGLFEEEGQPSILIFNDIEGIPLNYDLLAAIHPLKNAVAYLVSSVRYTRPEHDDPENGELLSTAMTWWRRDYFHDRMPSFDGKISWPDLPKEKLNDKT